MKSKLNVFWIQSMFSMRRKGEKVVMHIQVCTVRIDLSWRQGHASSSEQFMMDLPKIGESWGLCMAGFERMGWCNIYKHRIRGKMTQIDGWQRFVLPHTQTTTVNDIRCPWTCISVLGSLSIQLSISGHRAWLYATVGVTSAYSHNVCILFSAHTLHNDSVCSTDASQREQRVSHSNSPIYGW